MAITELQELELKYDKSVLANATKFCVLTFLTIEID